MIFVDVGDYLGFVQRTCSKIVLIFENEIGSCVSCALSVIVDSESACVCANVKCESDRDCMCNGIIHADEYFSRKY